MLGRLAWKTKRWINRALHARDYVLLSYASAERKNVMRLARQVAGEVDFLLDPSESCQIVDAVRATAKTMGDLAEVGVYQGGSAKLMAEHKGSRALHLFDTFEGLPAADCGDSSRFRAGQYRSDFDSVARYLASYSAVHLYKGLFPQTAAAVESTRFSFVHLDVDLYASTLAGLEFFYPRLSSGGILISHDYGNAEGVKRAFDEFFADKPEPVLEVALSQGLFVKI